MTLTPSHTPAAAAAAAVDDSGPAGPSGWHRFHRCGGADGAPRRLTGLRVLVAESRKRRVLRQPDPPERHRHVRPAHQVLSRCNNRRAVACPSCSDLYARDTWQLVHAGLHGGHHHMPSTIAEHPQVFVTLTAPGFGPVHTTRDDTHNSHGRRCHDPGRSGYRRCRHGKPLWCSTIHGDNDARVGQPLCEDCYDYTGHVLFAWHAPELWRRFTITLRRLLDSHQRAMGESANSVRINYVKVAETPTPRHPALSRRHPPGCATRARRAAHAARLLDHRDRLGRPGPAGRARRHAHCHRS